MKIIFYRGDYPKKFNTQTFLNKPVGGTEFAAGYLALELAKNHDVYFICRTPKEAKIDNIQWIPVSNLQYPNLKKAFQKVGAAQILILVGGLSNILEKIKPQVRKTICWANGLSLKPNTIRHLLQNKIQKVVCTTAYARNQVLGNTQSRLPFKKKIEYFLKVKKCQELRNKFTFIYNGVNLKLFKKEAVRKTIKKPYKILYAGVFAEQKNPDKILKAFPQIKKELPQAELHMCGSISQYGAGKGDKVTGYFDGNEFFAQIKKYLYNSKGNLKPGIHLRGALTPKKLAQEMLTSSLVVVNPKVGNQESSCIGALEAQAAGTPVIGGGDSALCETIQHKKTGIVFLKQENLAPWIIKILKNPNKAKGLGENGRKRAFKGFGWKNLAGEWEELLEAVLNDREYIPRKH